MILGQTMDVLFPKFEELQMPLRCHTGIQGAQCCECVTIFDRIGYDLRVHVIDHALEHVLGF